MTTPFLIWSIAHSAWWRTDAAGYTADIAKAGVFTDHKVESHRERRVYLSEAYADLMHRRAELYSALARTCSIEAALRGWVDGTAPLPEARPVADVSAMRIADLELSIRSGNCLRMSDIMTVGDLVARSSAELLRIPHLGRRSLREVKDVLTNMGLRLREST
jgi:hypothetical protein